MTRIVRIAVALVLFLGVGTAGARGKQPKPKRYATTICVAEKQKAASRFCHKTFSAWSAWEKSQDDARRDQALARATAELSGAWAKAEAKSAGRGADCADTTITASGLGAFVDSAIGAIIDDLNSRLDLGDAKEAGCGAKALAASAELCGRLLGAESTFTANVVKKGARETRDRAQAKALDTAETKIGRLLERDCPLPEDLLTDVADLVGRIKHDTLNSPNVEAAQFETIDPAGPVEYEDRTFQATCMDGSPYAYFARRGTVNKLLVYYQGGGACWEQLTCTIPTCDDSVGPGDDPNGFNGGFADLDNPDNPFRDWNAVFVSYCSCDIHFGDAAQDYDNFDPANPLHVEHRGYQNAKIVEKWAREHFVAPDEVFVTGSSAGAYGAWFHGPLLHEVWPSARFFVLADAGNGVVTQEFLESFFPNWNFEGNLPPDIPELRQVLDEGLGIPGYTEVVTKEFPQTLWAHYTTAFDGGSGGQTGFYNLMLNDNDVTAALTWWEGSCAWNDAMRQQAIGTAAEATDNYRYYIGTGSRHTMWGSNKVYGDTTGGVPAIVDWLDAMLASTATSADPGWTNVECTNCGLLLPGDPRPNPLQPPFQAVGSDVVIQCAASPSGAFVDAPGTERRGG